MHIFLPDDGWDMRVVVDHGWLSGPGRLLSFVFQARLAHRFAFWR